MGRQPRWTGVLIVAVAVAFIVLLATVWAATPEDLRGVFLLVGGAVALVVSVLGYVVQRRLHW